MTSKSFGAKNIDVSSGLNVSGVGTFTTGLDLDGYLQDKDGNTGNDNQVLISKDVGGSQKVEWANLSAVTSNNDSAGIGFTDLNDTPSALGGAGKIITVNTSNTELEFSTNNFLNLNDTPINYSGQGGKLVAVKTDLSGTQKIEFVDSVSITKLVVSGPLVEKFIRIDCSTETSTPINVSLNLNLGNVFQIVLKDVTDNHIISFTNCPASESNNEAYSFTVIVTNTRNNTVVTWPNYETIKWAGNPDLAGNADDSTQTVPTRSTKKNKSDVWVFTTYDGGDTYLGVLASFGYHGLPTS